MIDLQSITEYGKYIMLSIIYLIRKSNSRIVLFAILLQFNINLVLRNC